MEHESVKVMWDRYLSTLPHEQKEKKVYTSWCFSDNEQSANHLAELVKSGVKTATCSLHLLYELDGDPLPKVGDFNIITNWDGIAEVVTETVQVQVIPFRNVTEEHARKEGEGDRTLDYWRAGHHEFFTRALSPLNREFSEDMLIVCEEFKVVYS